MDMDRINKVIELMREHDLCEFSIEEEDFKLTLKRGQLAAPVQVPPAAAVPAGEPCAGSPAAPVSAAEANLVPIQSPLVGTFYRASAPDADPFVAVGTRVTKDSVVCIIEAMKVMNEIKAETSGVIKKILVENATAVQYGQPMFLVEPS
ncbi:MAG: acetyl-CoA carboxylase biotin carboxyl carrier protein [Kiritimatiellae bacterium]|nr:acetyl-CoA carboxylase biotin carboxyl carrier protein [Kiritimatiellia bacterium]NLD89336.1 acetyl-CoA carboxylase biotin carboxyl carrier protein [Lentisphaerota bacterium]HOU21188.1 acetyl-CoA carboxylase biotin carboxyl carrier protein [Kiritimatiellia bacterium]HPC19758.1 acetyl-CoA carboxylase biotin carboxyl carrier protein [Kiritimatiellia bacterium]